MIFYGNMLKLFVILTCSIGNLLLFYILLHYINLLNQKNYGQSVHHQELSTELAGPGPAGTAGDQGTVEVMGMKISL